MAQTLQTIISLSGRVDNSFGAIGDALLNVGNHIDALSQKIIDFGKESVEEYVDYDDVMREVQALGEYDDKTMRVLDEYNRTIAQSSKYTMEQAAQAEVMMAQLGLNMDQTKTLMPTVMNLASAANIDLADSLDYLYYSLNALDLPMEYANTLSDQMAKTAAISAADIDTLGMSLQRLGSGAQFFAGGSSEILAILGGISQFGQDMQGSNAGTQLRNFMLTLLAPTGSKATLMESLGVTETEWADFESYMEDAGISVTDTADAMNELGLTVYDSTTGKLKPAIQIIGELNAALSSMPEADQNEILGKLFGKRTTTAALNLLASLSTIIDYQKQIEGGSAGYTEAMADTMEGGLGGTLRQFTAAWEAFKVTIGENIAPEVGAVAEWMTDITNALTNMDDTALSALTGAAEGIAVAGPGLILAAGAFKLIGFALTPVGQWAIGITLAAAAIGALTKGITEWREAAFESNFGDMELDNTALMAHVNAIGDAFNSTYEHVNSYNDALNTAVENYTTASTTLSGDLLTNMITGATLTSTQIEEIKNLGSTMGTELLNGISASFDKSAEYLTMLFGGNAAAFDPEYQDAILLADQMYQNLIGQAESLGREFGETLGSAMDDGIITGDEYNAIMEKMQAYNDAMAFALEADNAAALAQNLHKAQSVSWDSASSFLAEQAALMNDNIEQAELTHVGERAKWGVYFDEAIAQGWLNPNTGLAYSLADKDDFLADMDANYQAKIQGYQDQNAQVLMATFDALISQSDFSAALPFLRSALGDIDTMERDGVGALTLDDVDWAELDAAGLLPENIVAQIFGMHGSADKLRRLMEPYAANQDVARLMEQMGYLYALGQEAEAYQWRKDEFGESGGTIDPRGEFTTPEQLAYNQRKAELEASIAEATTSLSKLQAKYTNISSEIAERENRLAGNDRPWNYYLTSGEANDYMAIYGNVLGGNLTQQKESISIDIAEAEAQIAVLQSELASLTMPITIETVQEGSDPLAQLEEQGVEVSVDGDTTSLVATIEAENGQTLLEYVDGDASALSMAIYSEDGKTLLEYVTGDTSQLAAAINAYNGRTVTVNVVTSPIGGAKKFAEGGRATEASIFGEAGPEWAIPEEHTERTARLFDMAREASGFTWPELIARNGGLNAGGTVPTQIIYSPTIIANDATGVEDKLIADKERLDSWWKEKQMRDDVEVYA